MIDLIVSHKPQIAAVCKGLHVRRLEVFGSAATGRFDPAHSDVDFLVELTADDSPTGLLDRYLALAEQLERLLGRDVDLVTRPSLRNPYFRQQVDESRELVYEG